MSNDVASVHYRTLASKCLYCEKPPTAIRVTLTQRGAVVVASMCHWHSDGEIRSETQGMRNDPGTSDFYFVDAEKS